MKRITIILITLVWILSFVLPGLAEEDVETTGSAEGGVEVTVDDEGSQWKDRLLEKLAATWEKIKETYNNIGVAESATPEGETETTGLAAATVEISETPEEGTETAGSAEEAKEVSSTADEDSQWNEQENPAGKWEKTKEAYNTFYSEYIPGHLEIGTRIGHYTFTEDTQGKPWQGSFLGTLNEVHESQNYAPVKAFVQYKFNPNFGVGLSYDQFKAATGSSPQGEEGGDGTFDLKGVYFYVLGAYPNESRFTPFVELGIVRYSSEFDEKAWWYEGGKRVMNTESEVGSVIAVGCDIHVYEKWSVNVYFRHVNVDQDVDFYFQVDNTHTPGTFTLSHNEYGIGVKYSF